MEFTAAKVFFEGKKKDLILNNFIKENKHIIIVSLDKNLKKTPLQAILMKNIKSKRQIIINFAHGLIMELMHTWH